jgi:hypothetical protein
MSRAFEDSVWFFEKCGSSIGGPPSVCQFTRAAQHPLRTDQAKAGPNATAVADPFLTHREMSLTLPADRFASPPSPTVS